MIIFDQVTFTYPEAPTPALRDVNLTIPAGELALVVGPTGVGKSTLLRAINGLVPHFTGGELQGQVIIDGISTVDHQPRQFADRVGAVQQNPLDGFTTDVVEDELAYGMEQLGVEPAVMRRRVEETLDLLGIAPLRRRSLRSLSGGEQQRVAIGSVLTAGPQILVLDEPTSALDPNAAEDVLAAISRLVHDLGMTVVMAEHRLERVAEYADSVILVDGDGGVTHGPPDTQLAVSPVAPPVVRLGQLLRWDPPLPISVRDARRRVGDLPNTDGVIDRASPYPVTSGSVLLQTDRVVVTFGNKVALGGPMGEGVRVRFPSGEVTALMGRNGSGKSTLLWTLQGTQRRDRGTVETDGVDPASLNAGDRRARVGLVPQSASDLLFLPTVDDECDESDRSASAEPGSTRALLDRLASGIPGDRHPRDLSEGQQMALALSIQLAAEPPVILLDEPTRGLDEIAKRHLGAHLRRLAANGHAVVVATHDVEFVASTADRVVVLAEGEIVVDGPTRAVVVGSPIFAPQIAKVFRPIPLLTVADVAATLNP